MAVAGEDTTPAGRPAHLARCGSRLPVLDRAARAPHPRSGPALALRLRGGLDPHRDGVRDPAVRLRREAPPDPHLVDGVPGRLARPAHLPEPQAAAARAGP